MIDTTLGILYNELPPYLTHNTRTGTEESMDEKETSQELRMLSSVTLDCQVTNIVINSGSQL